MVPKVNHLKQIMNSVESAVQVNYGRLPMDLDWDNVQTTLPTSSSSLLHHIVDHWLFLIPLRELWRTEHAPELAFVCHSRYQLNVPRETAERQATAKCLSIYVGAELFFGYPGIRRSMAVTCSATVILSSSMLRTTWERLQPRLLL